MEVAAKVNEAISESMGRRREAKIRDLVRCRAWAERERMGRGPLPARISLGLDDGSETLDQGVRDGAEGEEREDGEEDDDDEQHGNGDTGDIMVQ